MVELQLRTCIKAPIDRCFDLSRSIDLHLLGTSQTREQAVGGVTSGLIGMGQEVRWRARHFGVIQHLVSRITAYDRPAYLQDTMIEGVFRFMQHDHIFTALPGSETEMIDHFRFAAPLPVIGLLAERLVLKRYMKNFLRRRNGILKRVAESDEWKLFLPDAKQ